MTTGNQKISGRVLLFTGEGKGKTTAALGMVLRAAGHGQKILVIQFVKHDARTGEIKACSHLPNVKILQVGRGFVPDDSTPDFAAHKEAAEKGLETAAAAMSSGEYRLVVLDEICVAVSKGLLEEDRVLEAVKAAFAETCVVLTGRPLVPGLVSLADTVTEMRSLKHAFEAGCRAQEGVEY